MLITVSRSVGSGTMPSLPARKLMPTKRVTNNVAIISSTTWALCDSRGLNAGIPSATASIPVRATAPDENARNRSSSVNGATASCPTKLGGA